MHLSNSNLVHIDNGFLSKKRPNNENDKEWIGKDKKKEFLQINLRCCTDFILDKRTLLEEVWSIILGYLMPIDLFNVSVC